MLCCFNLSNQMKIKHLPKFSHKGTQKRKRGMINFRKFTEFWEILVCFLLCYVGPVFSKWLWNSGKKSKKTFSFFIICLSVARFFFNFVLTFFFDNVMKMIWHKMTVYICQSAFELHFLKLFAAFTFLKW